MGSKVLIATIWYFMGVMRLSTATTTTVNYYVQGGGENNIIHWSFTFGQDGVQANCSFSPKADISLEFHLIDRSEGKDVYKLHSAVCDNLSNKKVNDDCFGGNNDLKFTFYNSKDKAYFWNLIISDVSTARLTCKETEHPRKLGYCVSPLQINGGVPLPYKYGDDQIMEAIGCYCCKGMDLPLAQKCPQVKMKLAPPMTQKGCDKGGPKKCLNIGCGNVDAGPKALDTPFPSGNNFNSKKFRWQKK